MWPRHAIFGLGAALLLGGGCHLIFQYEDNAPDGSPGIDARRDTVADKKKPPTDKKGGVDKKAPPDKASPPDITKIPDKLVPMDLGCPPGKLACGGGCINPLTNKKNCGGCGTKCDDGSACTTDTCSKGKCQYSDVSGGSCKVGSLTGICSAGKCCTTCLHLGACVASTSSSSFGKGGATCASCPYDTSKICQEPVCKSGVCGHQNSAYGTACQANGVAGKCKNGVCCTTCWSGGTCVPLTSQTQGVCGKAGATCASCDDNNVCTYNQCDGAGVCQHPYKVTSFPCQNGKCLKGVCCVGCMKTSLICLPFTSQTDLSCGAGGMPCNPCQYTGTDQCQQGVCDQTSGVCAVGNKPDKTACKTNLSGYLCCSGVCVNKPSGSCT